jgi:transketolase
VRNAFAAELVEQADEYENLVFLSGDIGNRMFDSFKEKFANRFYNCGIAEANMTGVAAGLALSGKKPITYTITPFNTARCYEQIKIDVCYNNIPVIIVGVGAGLSYASLGATHQSLDDIAMMKNLPNMNVFCPGDAMEVRACVREALRLNGPAYIRLGKKNEPVYNESIPLLKLGKMNVHRNGEKVCLISCGNILPVAYECVELFKKDNISPELISCFSVKPLDEEYLEEAFEKFDLVISIEEHGMGGLSAGIMDLIHEKRMDFKKYLKIHSADQFYSYTGGQTQARIAAGLEASQIIEKARERLE